MSTSPLIRRSSPIFNDLCIFTSFIISVIPHTFRLPDRSVSSKTFKFSPTIKFLSTTTSSLIMNEFDIIESTAKSLI